MFHDLRKDLEMIRDDEVTTFTWRPSDPITGQSKTKFPPTARYASAKLNEDLHVLVYKSQSPCSLSDLHHLCMVIQAPLHLFRVSLSLPLRWVKRNIWDVREKNPQVFVHIPKRILVYSFTSQLVIHASFTETQKQGSDMSKTSRRSVFVSET